MKLYVVRHGETEENTKDVYQGQSQNSLSLHGTEQVEVLAEKLKDYKFEHIYSSDLKRCVETAHIIKKYHADTPITYSDKIREIRYGELEGKDKKDVDWKNFTGGDIYEGKSTGGESLNDLRDRAFLFIEDIKRGHTKGNLLIITHRGIIRALINIFWKLPRDHIFESVSIHNASCFEIDIEEGMVIDRSVS